MIDNQIALLYGDSQADPSLLYNSNGAATNTNAGVIAKDLKKSGIYVNVFNGTLPVSGITSENAGYAVVSDYASPPGVSSTIHLHTADINTFDPDYLFLIVGANDAVKSAYDVDIFNTWLEKYCLDLFYTVARDRRTNMKYIFMATVHYQGVPSATEEANWDLCYDAQKAFPALWDANNPELAGRVLIGADMRQSGVTQAIADASDASPTEFMTDRTHYGVRLSWYVGKQFGLSLKSVVQEELDPENPSESLKDIIWNYGHRKRFKN